MKSFGLLVLTLCIIATVGYGVWTALVEPTFTNLAITVTAGVATIAFGLWVSKDGE